jgi:thioredoxin 1
MSYLASQPERSALDQMPGLVVLDFGTDWCGYCRAGAPLIRAALNELPEARHVPVEDGPGRPLGRSFRIKLWPTIVVLKDGVEVARVTRPETSDDVRAALALGRSA